MTPSRPPHPPGGFTMLEIMIVIAVAGLVMATSIPFVQHTVRRDAVYTAVKVVDEACRNARALAIFNNMKIPLAMVAAGLVFREAVDWPRLALGGAVIACAFHLNGSTGAQP